MTITALAEDTVRLLGSHTVITTPVDLVKELLDNAIDAKATSVEILVSPNIVDRIEARDNGHGIHADDYDSLGRPGHTSKIKAFDDVRTLGGTTLGFRGQALASANTVGTVTVTTRTVEDPTAVVLKLSPGVGGVESQQRSPAPAGTTVTVAGLYSRLPVREQMAIKDAQKNLANIKHLLQSYALARPQIRLSFRVLGGNNKLSFSYSPRSEAGIKEAVVQIFGTDLATQCLIETICSTSDKEGSDNLKDAEKYCIQAVLPRPDADQACVSKGPFISVDSRPVSAQRETMKKLLATFKNQFSNFVEVTYGEKSFRNPFICVNIKCSLGTYDPNIEPSKNVMLFANESQVTDLFERLCSDVYKIKETPDPSGTIGRRQLSLSSQAPTPPTSSDGPGVDDEVAMDRNNRPQPHVAQLDVSQSNIPRPDTPHLDASGSSITRDWLGQMQDLPIPSSPRPTDARPTRPVPRRQPAPAKVKGGFSIDMSADPNRSSDEESSQEEISPQVEEEIANQREGLNPWVIAKMNAPLRQEHSVQIREQPSPVPDAVFENLPILRPFGEAPGDLHGAREHRLDITQMGRQQQLPGFSPLNLPTIDYHVGRDFIGPGTRPAGQCESQVPSHVHEAHGRRTLPNLLAYHNAVQHNIEHDALIQSRLPFGGQPEYLPNNTDARAHRHIDEIPSRSNPPFRKPKRTKLNAGKRHKSSSHPEHSRNPVAEWVHKHGPADYDVGSMRHPSTQQLSDSPRPSTRNTNASIRDSQRGSAMTRPSDSRSDKAWVDGDSRKFLMKRQKSDADNRRRGRPTTKRVKTDRLPLETVPQSQGLQSLVLNVAPDTEKLAWSLDSVVGDDAFCDAFRSDIELKEEMRLDDAVEVEVRLKNLVSAWAKTIRDERIEVNIDLRTQLKGKGVAA